MDCQSEFGWLKPRKFIGTPKMLLRDGLPSFCLCVSTQTSWVIWRAKCPPTMLFNLKSQHVLKVYKHYYCVWGNRKSQIAERKTVSIRGGLNSSMIIEMIFFRLIRIQTLLQAPSTFLLIVANRRIVFSLSCFTAVVPRFATVCHFCRGQ